MCAAYTARDNWIRLSPDVSQFVKCGPERRRDDEGLAYSSVLFENLRNNSHSHSSPIYQYFSTMLPRPEVLHQSTFNIPATENPPGSAIEENPPGTAIEENPGKRCFLEIQGHSRYSYALTVPDKGDPTSYLLNSSIHGSLGQFFRHQIFM